MSVADDYGRFYASPITLRGACFPSRPDRVSEHDIATWLGECAAGEEPLVTLYQVGGNEFLQINNFRQQTRTKSKFPDCLSNANQLLSRCEANAQPSRSRISESNSYSESAAGAEQEPPLSHEELKAQVKTLANLKSMSDPASDRRKICKQLLMAYPEARGLPGEPDGAIVAKCLNLSEDSPDRLQIALESMFRAMKKPETSWAWFPVVLAQYLQPRRGIQRERRA